MVLCKGSSYQVSKAACLIPILNGSSEIQHFEYGGVEIVRGIPLQKWYPDILLKPNLFT
jgi:hypothetical protein